MDWLTNCGDGLDSFCAGFRAARMPKLHVIQQSLNDSVATVVSLLSSTSIQEAPDLANCFPESQFRVRCTAKQQDSSISSHWSAKFESLRSRDSTIRLFRSNLLWLSGFCWPKRASRAVSLQLNFWLSTARSLPTWQHFSTNLLFNKLTIKGKLVLRILQVLKLFAIMNYCRTYLLTAHLLENLNRLPAHSRAQLRSQSQTQSKGQVTLKSTLLSWYSFYS